MLWKTAKASNSKVHIQNQLQESKSPFLNTPCRKVLLEKLTRSQLVKEFPAFYGTRKSITAFASGRHLSILSQINPVHAPTSHFL